MDGKWACWRPWFVVCILCGLLFLKTETRIPGLSPKWFGTEATAWAATASQDDENYLDDPFAERETSVADPLQPLNRAFFHFNDKLYFWVLKPVATVYKTFVPTGVRLCVRNAFTNLMAPVRIANNLLQLKFQRGIVEVARFGLNSTLGAAGLFDPAEKEFGLKPYDEDFGQTLGHYRVGNGIFFMWPVLGPSTLRDTVGLVADYFLDPMNYLAWEAYGPAKGVKEVNRTSLSLGQYEDFKASALDPYVSMRNAYISYRHRQVNQ